MTESLAKPVDTVHRNTVRGRPSIIIDLLHEEKKSFIYGWVGGSKGVSFRKNIDMRDIKVFLLSSQSIFRSGGGGGGRS